MRPSASCFSLALLAVGAAALLGASPTAAQQIVGSSCDLVDYRVLASEEPQPGRRITRIGRPEVVCPDGTRIQADSAVIRQEARRYELMGSVRYDSPDRELRATMADYFEAEERLEARGSVELRQPVEGSEVRGDTLIILMAGAVREEDDLTVWGDRASATLPQEESDPAAEPSRPYEVVARWLRFEGERFLRAQGDAEVDRDGMRTFSDSLSFDRTEGHLSLIGAARLEAEGATFSGQRIVLLLPDDELRSIEIEEDGRIVTEDLEVLGDEIRVAVQEEEIQGLVAVDRQRSQAAPDDGEVEEEAPAIRRDPVTRPQVITEEFFLTGDSIDVRSPGNVLEAIHAVGMAWSETRPPGTPAPDPRNRPSEREVVGPQGGALERDWLEGDTIVATFASAPPSGSAGASDTDAGDDYVLDRLVATGTARALYRSPPDGDRSNTASEPNTASVPNTAAEPNTRDRSRWAVSYVLADAIVISLLDGQMDRVEAEGNLRGVQLDPEAADDPSDESEEDASDETEEPA